MVRKIGRSPWTQHMAGPHLRRPRPGDPEAQVRGQIHSWWAAVGPGPPQPHARGAGSRSQHPFFPANVRSVSGSLARHLCTATSESQELPQLLEPADTVRASASGFAIVWGAFASGNSEAL